MKKIEKPGKGTKIRETSRVAAESGMSLLPGGGIFNTLVRKVFPSKLDKQKADWADEVTQATNRQGEEVEALKDDTNALQLEQTELSNQLDDTRDHVDELARKVDVGVLDDDPLDGELEICRGLVLSGKFQTALDLLKERFEDPKRSNQISPKLMARVRSLQGMCLKNMGKYDEASEHFLTALKIDPESPKIRANAVVGYLMVGQFDESYALLDALLVEEPELPMHWANLIYTKSAEGIVFDAEKVPKAVRHNEDVAISLVYAKRANEDKSWTGDAIKCASLHPNSTRAVRLGAEAALEIALESHLDDTEDPAVVTAKQVSAREAAQTLEAQWSEHLTSETAKALPDFVLLQNTIVAHRLTGNRFAAEALVNAHTDLLLSDLRSREIVGSIAIETHNDVLLDRVLQGDFEGAAILKLERALSCEDWEEALDLCETYPEEIGPKGRIDPAFMAEVLRAMTGNKEHQEATFHSLLDQAATQTAENELLVSQMASKAGLNDLSDEVFKQATGRDLGDDAELRRAMAAEAMKRDLPDVAIDLLVEYVDPVRDSRMRNWLATSYARTSVPRETGIAFFKAIREAHVSDGEINRAGGHYHLNRRKPGEAAPWFKRSLAIEPNNVRTQIAYWQALSRDGADKRAREFLDQVKLDELEGPDVDRMGMAQLLWRTGRIEAIDFAYELAVQNRNDFQLCILYSGLILGDAFGAEVKPIEAVADVRVGAMVRLTRPNHADWTVVITEEDTNLHDHVSVSNPIVRSALGKRAGDKFVTTAGPNTFEWTVAELKPKYLHLFHEITRTLQDQFPDNGSFYSITTLNDDVEPILESLRQRRSSIENLDDQYRDNPMPLGCVAGAGGGGVIDYAVHLAQSGRQVFSATGLLADTDRELVIAKNGKNSAVILDVYTAWLLGTLNLLEATRELYPNLIIPASAIDDLSGYIEQMGGDLEGRKTMSAQGDGFILQEFTAEEVASQTDEMRKLRDSVVRNCEVVGIEASPKLSAGLLGLAEFMGSQFDSLTVAHREGGTLLSADLRLRQVATEISKSDAFGMDALLLVLAGEGIISVEAYADALLKLCSHGHSYVSLNSITLMRLLMADDTADLQRFAFASTYLGTPNADISGHITTAAQFVRRAFIVFGGDLKAQRATSMVLRNLIRLRGVPVAQVLQAVVQQANHGPLTNYVMQWIRGHFLSETVNQQIEEQKEL